MHKPILMLAVLATLAGCGEEPTTVPVSVEVVNFWGESDHVTVEYRLGTDGPATQKPINSAALAANTGKVTSPAPLSLEPGATFQTRLLRLDHQDETFWTSSAVPSDWNPKTPLTLNYTLATDTSTPSCPNGLSTCVLMRWAPGGEYVKLETSSAQ